VPAGSYLVSGRDGAVAVERFRCAAGPAGWRYVATRADHATGAELGRLDLTLDAAGRAVRLLVAAGGWELRGGALGSRVQWRRGGAEHDAAAAGFTGTSPAYAVATAQLLRLPAGGRRRVRLVAVTEPALGTLAVDEGWALTGVERHGGLTVERYEVADLATGERRVVHLSGDLVVDATGVELTGVEPSTAPSRDDRRGATPG
jgi:hypothetical protein